jgi:hypothetical protein
MVKLWLILYHVNHSGFSIIINLFSSSPIVKIYKLCDILLYIEDILLQS